MIAEGLLRLRSVQIDKHRRERLLYKLHELMGSNEQ